eukprot:TRINITY_DN6988_c0_g2_i1.p1 TRINITY_DN6988_c0_g2~~TRINITY_DN6988_c0_g2_i1.p1  ORF type:complete len:108 (-),score=16.00 TRINITY_DN6988_c0_g2_i1:9-332(-)
MLAAVAWLLLHFCSRLRSYLPMMKLQLLILAVFVMASAEAMRITRVAMCQVICSSFAAFVAGGSANPVAAASTLATCLTSCATFDFHNEDFHFGQLDVSAETVASLH